MMKKFILSSSVIITFALYTLFLRAEKEKFILPPVTDIKRDTSSDLNVGPIPNTNSNQTPNAAQNVVPQTKNSKTGYKDGTYTGNIADAYYGNVQVRAVIQNGRIVDIQFLEYPSDRRRSIDINRRAIPYLKQEAIQAQSAEVDIISGATQTSLAFQESLASALAQAK